MINIDAFKKALLEYFAIRNSKPQSELERLKTHSTEIMRIIEHSLIGLVSEGSKESYYVSYGIVTELQFADGKRYQIQVKPLPENTPINSEGAQAQGGSLVSTTKKGEPNE